MSDRLRVCFYLCFLVSPLPTCLAVGAERNDEVVQLQERIAQLEAENQQLRERLRQIANLAVGASTKPQPDLTIVVVSDDWGGARRADVDKVLNSAALPIWQSAGSPPLHLITVVNHSSDPCVAYERGPFKSYRVLLNVRGRLWAKLAYQFSHEMGHILANYRNVPNRQGWFEESLCECASLYCLRKMGRTWKTKPPYVNWSTYADALTGYADDLIDGTAEIPKNDLAAWYSAKRSRLEKNSTDRELNLVVAVRLLPIFEKYPNSWKAVRSLNKGDAKENENFHGYLQAWYSRVADAERPVVKDIASLFSIALPGA